MTRYANKVLCYSFFFIFNFNLSCHLPWTDKKWQKLDISYVHAHWHSFQHIRLNVGSSHACFSQPRTLWPWFWSWPGGHIYVHHRASIYLPHSAPLTTHCSHSKRIHLRKKSYSRFISPLYTLSGSFRNQPPAARTKNAYALKRSLSPHTGCVKLWPWPSLIHYLLFIVLSCHYHIGFLSLEVGPMEAS